MQLPQLTTVIQQEGQWYVAICPELDVVSQAGSEQDARANLNEAINLFLETADREEISRRLESAHH